MLGSNSRKSSLGPLNRERAQQRAAYTNRVKEPSRTNLRDGGTYYAKLLTEKGIKLQGTELDYQVYTLDKA